MDNANLLNLQRLSPEDIPTHEQLKQILKFFKDRTLLLRNIIQINPFPIAIWDKNGHFVSGNIGYQNLFGGTPPPEYSIFNDEVLQNLDIYEDFLGIKKGEIQQFPSFYYNSHDINPDYPDNPIWFETTVTPIVNEQDDIECYLFVYVDVTEIKKLKIENKLLHNKVQEAKSEILNIIKEFEQSKKVVKAQTLSEIKRNILPLIQKLRENKSVNIQEIELLEKSLLDIPDTIILKKALLNKALTPSEIKVCELALENITNKEISNILNVSESTIHTHILHIRKKLSIKGDNISLSHFLKELL